MASCTARESTNQEAKVRIGQVDVGTQVAARNLTGNERLAR